MVHIKKIITISGKAGHGKDQSAKFIKNILEEKGRKVLIVHYADYLKFICERYYGWDGQKDEKGRTLLQYIGTDKARTQVPDFWSRIVENFLDVFADDWDAILIPDARFENELLRHRDDVLNLKVCRLNYESKLTKEQQQHLSEIALDDCQLDYLVGGADLDQLKKSCDKFVSDFLTIENLRKNYKIEYYHDEPEKIHVIYVED